MRLSGFLQLPQLADESPSPTWRARGGRWVYFAGLSSTISFTIGTSPMGSATCVEQRELTPQAAGCRPFGNCVGTNAPKLGEGAILGQPLIKPGPHRDRTLVV